MRTPRASFELAALGTVALALVLAFVACGGESFDPQSKVRSVRMFGVRADKPFAKPGETVNLEVLLADGRVEKPRPLKLFWIPILCVNPPRDLYYLCFAPSVPGTRFVPVGPLADAGVPEAGAGPTGLDAGAAAGGPLAAIPMGVDLSPLLPQGPTFSFQMPEGAIIEREGLPPYGLAIVFNIACAGQVRLANAEAGGGPQQLPVQCTDENGAPLPPSDYVIGISRVYAYADRDNQNPVVERITVRGEDVDPAAGVTIAPCTEKDRMLCPENPLDVRVTDASWEQNPTPGGEPLREQLWISWFSDVGEIEVSARLLFDTRKGRPESTKVAFRAPPAPGAGTLWGVVHDSRGGQTFIVLPVTVR